MAKDETDEAKKERRKKRKRDKEHDRHKSSKTRREDVNDEQFFANVGPTRSPFYEQSYSMYVSLSPIAQSSAVAGLCAEHLSPLILTYYPPFAGIILSYSNPRCSTDRPRPAADDTDGRQKVYARSVNEYGAAFVWLTADFVIFRPQRGDILEGVINLQNATNLSLLCWNYFAASIRAEQLPKNWKWVSRRKKQTQDEPPEMVDGHFVNGQGKRVEGTLSFQVLQVDTPTSVTNQGGILSIRGSLTKH